MKLARSATSLSPCHWQDRRVAYTRATEFVLQTFKAISFCILHRVARCRPGRHNRSQRLPSGTKCISTPFFVLHPHSLVSLMNGIKPRFSPDHRVSRLTLRLDRSSLDRLGCCAFAAVFQVQRQRHEEARQHAKQQYLQHNPNRVALVRNVGNHRARANGGQCRTLSGLCQKGCREDLLAGWRRSRAPLFLGLIRIGVQLSLVLLSLSLCLLLARLDFSIKLQGVVSLAQHVGELLSALQFREAVRDHLRVINPFPNTTDGLHALVQYAELYGCPHV
jgi:hypothetical protein